jgi:hypothetical protein
MTPPLLEVRQSLLAFNAYVADSVYLSLCTWKALGTVQVLVNKKEDLLAAGIVVRCILDLGLDVGPLANWNPVEKFKLARAQYRFASCHPDNTVFAKDYDQAVDVIKDLQSTITSMTDHRYFLTPFRSYTTSNFLPLCGMSL